MSLSVDQQPVLQTLLPWSVISVTGTDAATFLQGQVTTDIREVSAGHSRPGNLLNLKGRIESNFYLCSQDNGFLLVIDQSLQEATLARLKKYGVFSKVSIENSPLVVIGHTGQAALAQLTQQGVALPETSNQCISADGEYWLRLHGQTRLVQLCPAEKLPSTIHRSEAALNAWWANSILAGDWLINAAAQARYQPQELDAHQLQGVSYQKGCYMGQEIVARLYFRGQLKSELKCLQATLSGQPDIAIGQTLLAGTQSAGEIVACAPYGPSQWLALAVVRNEHQTVDMSLADGSVVHWQAQAFQR